MQSATQLLDQALRCVQLARNTHDESLAKQLIELSEQLSHEADVAVMRGDAE
jgi:hypothetical protein